MPSLTVENYVKSIALIAARNPAGTAVGTGRAGPGAGGLAGDRHRDAQDALRGGAGDLHALRGRAADRRGQRLALKVIRRHRLLELFLARTLEMSWDEVHEEAEHMEHAASERLIDRIEAFLGHPAVDPHGDPIPRADGSLTEPEGIPLSQCGRGQQFRVVRVVDQDPAFLRYLTECGLDLHAEGELVENRPESAAVVCRLGGRDVALGLSAAEKVLVQTALSDHERNTSSPVAGSRSIRKWARSIRGGRPRTRSATSSAVAGESWSPARLWPVATIRLR